MLPGVGRLNSGSSAATWFLLATTRSAGSRKRQSLRVYDKQAASTAADQLQSTTPLPPMHNTLDQEPFITKMERPVQESK